VEPNRQCAKCYAKEGKADELERLIRILIRLVESEPGTLEYSIARDHEDPDHFFVFERYSGREAFEKHCASPEYQDLLVSGTFASPPKPKVLKQLKAI
jgi:quinol monooxygenase YgiN